MVVLFRQRIMIGRAVAGALGAVALAGTTVSGASPPAAAPISIDTHRPAHVQKAQDVINLLDPYVVRMTDGTLTLTAPTSVLNAVDTATLSQIRSGLAHVNQEIRAGRLVATADHGLYDPTNSTLSVQGGWTGIRWYWWGFDVYLSEFYTQKFMGALAGGVALFTLCMTIPAIANQAACGPLAAAFALLGAYIWIIDNGNGVVFDKQWWSFGTFYAQ